MDLDQLDTLMLFLSMLPVFLGASILPVGLMLPCRECCCPGGVCESPAAYISEAAIDLSWTTSKSEQKTLIKRLFVQSDYLVETEVRAITFTTSFITGSRTYQVGPSTSWRYQGPARPSECTDIKTEDNTRCTGGTLQYVESGDIREEVSLSRTTEGACKNPVLSASFKGLPVASFDSSVTGANATGNVYFSYFEELQYIKNNQGQTVGVTGVAGTEAGVTLAYSSVSSDEYQTCGLYSSKKYTTIAGRAFMGPTVDISLGASCSPATAASGSAVMYYTPQQSISYPNGRCNGAAYAPVENYSFERYWDDSAGPFGTLWYPTGSATGYLDRPITQLTGNIALYGNEWRPEVPSGATGTVTVTFNVDLEWTGRQPLPI